MVNPDSLDRNCTDSDCKIIQYQHRIVVYFVGIASNCFAIRWIGIGMYIEYLSVCMREMNVIACFIPLSYKSGTGDRVFGIIKQVGFHNGSSPGNRNAIPYVGILAMMDIIMVNICIIGA